MCNFCVKKCKTQIKMNDKYMKNNNLTIIQTLMIHEINQTIIRTPIFDSL